MPRLEGKVALVTGSAQRGAERRAGSWPLVFWL
jgi:hypothetical protein